MVVQAGRTYRVRAVGAAHFKNAGAAAAAVSPDGGSEMSANGLAPLGMLMGQIDSRTGVYFKLGSNGRFTAEKTGKLLLLLNCVAAEQVGATGGAVVLIEQE
jgi:hypothetical protein